MNDGASRHYRLQETGNRPRKLRTEGSDCVVDGTGFIVAILVGHRATVPMIAAFLTGTEHASI